MYIRPTVANEQSERGWLEKHMLTANLQQLLGREIAYHLIDDVAIQYGPLMDWSKR